MLAVSRSRPRAAILQRCCLDSTAGRGYRRRDTDRPSIQQQQGASKSESSQRWHKAKQDVERSTSKENDGPSLFEQLFPEQRAAEQRSHPPKSVPPPIPAVFNEEGSRSEHGLVRRGPSKAREEAMKRHWSEPKQLLRHDMQNQPLQTSVLVLRNASNNLVEEDFRRLVPKGKHMESWTMEQGDILSVVPMRNLATLAPLGQYYLLFSSTLSAFTYQGYASRIHRMVAAHTPSSLLSPIPPPPGYLIDGMDAHAAIDSFTLVPPTQALELRQLKPPLTPLVQEIVQNGGYAALINREDRMPFEARITMDGPQLPLHSLRDALYDSAKTRALGWSGGDGPVPQLSKWSLPRRTADAETRQTEGDGASRRAGENARRMPSVYIAGFHTQRALQSFIAYWHRRPLATTGGPQDVDGDDELPPIANVEVLW